MGSGVIVWQTTAQNDSPFLTRRPFHSLRLQWAIAANMCRTAESLNHDHKERP